VATGSQPRTLVAWADVHGESIRVCGTLDVRVGQLGCLKIEVVNRNEGLALRDGSEVRSSINLDL
jgi:hypothetical protein